MATLVKTETNTRALIIVEHKEMIKGYRLGRDWLLLGEWEGSTPGSSYLIDNLKWRVQVGLFDGKHDNLLNWYVDFILGMLSSRIPIQAEE